MRHTQEFDDIIASNVFDIRDVIARFEELETDLERQAGEEDLGTWLDVHKDEDDPAEFLRIRSFLEDVAGSGGDEQWRGDWYPIGFVADRYFTDHARELAEDCDMIKRDATWPNNHIDWDAAASELQQDYTSIDIDGTRGRWQFWYR